jgi:hypothetical protein
MLGSRKITVTLARETVEQSAAKGCPQGGILSPLVWMNSWKNSVKMAVIH